MVNSLVLIPLGLGFLGFVEPLPIGSTLRLLKYLEDKDRLRKLWEVGLFTVTRALFVGLHGVVARRGPRSHRQEHCDRGIGIDGPLGDVTPVTGTVTYGQEDRLVLPSRPRERFLAPGIPIDRVMRVLQQIWIGEVDQSIGWAVLGVCALIWLAVNNQATTARAGANICVDCRRARPLSIHRLQ